MVQGAFRCHLQQTTEGYKGHGVLTYTLLEALNADEGTKKDEEVKLYQLAAHVQERVPVITQNIWGVRQQPAPKLAGNDFPLGIRQAVLTDEEVPITPTHVVIRTEGVRGTPAPDAPSERELPPGTLVRVVELVRKEWAVIARDGQKMGHVPIEALLKLD